MLLYPCESWLCNFDKNMMTFDYEFVCQYLERSFISQDLSLKLDLV